MVYLGGRNYSPCRGLIVNTLVHLAALIALLWFSTYTFGTLNIPALGYAVLGLFLGFIPLTFMAFQDDLEILRGRQDK